MNSYDVILTLGNGFNDTWGVPETVNARLQTVAELYKTKVSDKILISGGYSISWDVVGVKPPTTEAREMKKFLQSLEVPDTQIYTEEESKDTIGNFYFSKIRFLQPHSWNHILVVCTDVHLRRVKFLSKKILGPEYKMDYQTTPSHSVDDMTVLLRQEIVYEKQNLFLKDMPIGDESFLANKLYSDPFYTSRKSQDASEFAMKGVK